MAEHRPLAFRDFARDLGSASVRREFRTDWSMYVLYRRPGVVLAWLCYRLGIGPIGATLLGFAFAVTMPVQAVWAPMGWAPWGVLLAGVLFQILDCSDGTLARTTQRPSDLGADLDFFVGMAQYAMLYCAIGILADRTFGTEWAWTVLGALAVALRYLARMIRDQVAVRTGPSEPSPVTLMALPAIIIAGLSGLIPFLVLMGDKLHWAVWFLLIYAVLDIGEGLMPLTGPAYRKPENRP